MGRGWEGGARTLPVGQGEVHEVERRVGEGGGGGGGGCGCSLVGAMLVREVREAAVGRTLYGFSVALHAHCQGGGEPR